MSEKIIKKSEEREKMDELVEIAEEIVEKEVVEKKARGHENLDSWVPQTKLGKMVKGGKIKNIDEVLDNKMKILEPEIVDYLLSVDHDLLFVGQSKGKFGGGKRRAWRQSQKKTKEGNVITFSAFVVVGDKNGHVGVGFGKSKLNLIKIKRGSGSFEGSSHELHSIPLKVEGKCGSVSITLIPAPQGTGLVIGNEGKKILKLAGIQDIYSKSFGHKRTTMNYGKAVMEALKKLE